MPSSSNFLSCGPSSLSTSSEYDSPEHPPPLTPMRRNTLSLSCASMSVLTCFAAFSVIPSAIGPFPPCPRCLSLFRCRLAGGRFRGPAPLLLVVGEGRLDGVLGEHGAVDLHRRQLQLVYDVRVLDLGRLVHRPALEPLGGQARRGDGAAAAEGLELGVLDDPRLDVDLDLQLHDVAALRRAHQPGAHAGGFLAEG